MIYSEHLTRCSGVAQFFAPSLAAEGVRPAWA